MNKSPFRFTYGTPLIDRIFIIGPVFLLWAGSVLELHEQGFRGDLFSKITTSGALLYLVWHFMASRRPQEIRIGDYGLHIPNTWFPGLVEHHVSWQDIQDVDVSSKNHLPTICLGLREGKRRHIYIKGLSAYRGNRLYDRAGEKLFVYLCDILGIVK